MYMLTIYIFSFMVGRALFVSLGNIKIVSVLLLKSDRVHKEVWRIAC
jgi:hypothetical protein